jgi:hypothetical protein
MFLDVNTANPISFALKLLDQVTANEATGAAN